MRLYWLPTSAVDVLPFRMLGIRRRIQRIEGDVARAARHADEERRLDRAVEQPVGAGVRAFRLVRHRLAVALPGRRRSVQLAPLRGIEARIGKLAQAQSARSRCRTSGRRRFGAGRSLPCGVIGVERRILEVAGRIACSLPFRRISAARRRRGTSGSRMSRRGSWPGSSASPGTQQSGSGMAPQAWNSRRLFLARSIRYQSIAAAQPLRVGIGVEAVVEGGGVEPDLAARALGGREARIARGVAGTKLALRPGATRLPEPARGHEQQNQPSPGSNAKSHWSPPTRKQRSGGKNADQNATPGPASFRCVGC